VAVDEVASWQKNLAPKEHVISGSNIFLVRGSLVNVSFCQTTQNLFFKKRKIVKIDENIDTCLAS
jgi:hypothetical protein